VADDETPSPSLPTLAELMEGITQIEPGVYRLEPGYYWITLTKDPNDWYRDVLRNESMLGNLSIVRIAGGLPGHIIHPSVIMTLLSEEVRPGDWILFKVHRQIDWRMPYLGVYAWGPFHATRGAQTMPGDVGQDFTPINWWSPAEWDAPKFGAAVPWMLLAGALGTAVYLARKK
jgi:hypothetical protein